MYLFISSVSEKLVADTVLLYPICFYCVLVIYFYILFVQVLKLSVESEVDTSRYMSMKKCIKHVPSSRIGNEQKRDASSTLLGALIL